MFFHDSKLEPRVSVENKDKKVALYKEERLDTKTAFIFLYNILFYFQKPELCLESIVIYFYMYVCRAAHFNHDNRLYSASDRPSLLDASPTISPRSIYQFLTYSVPVRTTLHKNFCRPRPMQNATWHILCYTQE